MRQFNWHHMPVFYERSSLFYKEILSILYLFFLICSEKYLNHGMIVLVF